MTSLGEFRQDAKAFLESHAQRRTEQGTGAWGEGPDDVPNFESFSNATSEEVRAAKQWAATRFDAGFGWIDGPKDLGGAGLTAEHARVYRELESAYTLPNTRLLTIGTSIIAPALMKHGSADLHHRYLPGIYRGDIIACQLFSEPEAGSDLAAARTQANRRGDGWVINGQKVWTSNAHLADIGLAVTRTDPGAPKHRGLTVFIVDMRAPGVEVRPLRQMTGRAGFSETFLTDVAVTDHDRVGEVNAGFSVILTTLESERSIPVRDDGTLGPDFDRAWALVDRFDRLDDPVVRQQLAALYVVGIVEKTMADRLIGDNPVGATSGAGAAPMLLKLLSSQRNRQWAALLSNVLGDRLLADTGEWGTYAWAEFMLSIPGNDIGGGTNEIVKNRIGESVLGLPKEPR
jgi:acyl-CoA dehydrogenase